MLFVTDIFGGGSQKCHLLESNFLVMPVKYQESMSPQQPSWPERRYKHCGTAKDKEWRRTFPYSWPSGSGQNRSLTNLGCRKWAYRQFHQKARWKWTNGKASTEFIHHFLSFLISITLTGRQTTMSSRSVDARLARKVLVGDLKDLLLITVRMIKMFPETPNPKVKLQNKTTINCLELLRIKPVDKQRW